MIAEIFYITGRGGSISEGLGVFLTQRARKVSGISLSKEFLSSDFEDQLASIRIHFERIQRDAIPVIANSYGAYLLLNSLINLPKLHTKVLLLSPVVGTLVSEAGYFKPPFAKQIPNALREGKLIKPDYLAICVGMLDNQCDLAALDEIAEKLSADQYAVIEDQGHMIDNVIVQAMVDEFLVVKTV